MTHLNPRVLHHKLSIFFLLILLIPNGLEGQVLDEGTKASPADTSKLRSFLDEASEHRGSKKRGLDRSEKALRYAEDHELPFWKARALEQKGKILKEHSVYDEALKSFKKAHRIYRRMGKSAHKAEVLSQIGIIHEIQGDFRKALDLQHQAKGIYKAAEDQKGLSKQYRNLGNIFQGQANYSKALEYYYKSEQIERRLKNDKGLAKTLQNIAIVSLNRGSYDRALQKFKESLARFKELELEEEVSKVHNNLGTLFLRRGELDSSLSYFRKSLKIKKGLGDSLGMAKIYNNLGGLHHRYHSQSDTIEKEHLLRAIKYQDQARNLAGKMNADKLKVEIHQSFGRIHQTLGIELGKISHLKKAIGKFRRAADLAHQVGSKSDEFRAHQKLSRLYDALGDPKKALSHYKRYASLKDSVHSTEKSREIALLQEERKRQLDELKKERERRRRAEKRTLQYSGITIFIVLLLVLVSYSGYFQIPIRIAEGAVFFSILLLFEFIMIGVSYLLQEQMSSMPIYRLMSNFALALLLFPLMNFLENKLRKRVQKLKEKEQK